MAPALFDPGTAPSARPFIMPGLRYVPDNLSVYLIIIWLGFVHKINAISPFAVIEFTVRYARVKESIECCHPRAGFKGPLVLP